MSAACPEECITKQIDYFTNQLQDKKSRHRRHRAVALMFLTHLIGDIHQPLHAAIEIRIRVEIRCSCESEPIHEGSTPPGIRFSWRTEAPHCSQNENWSICFPMPLSMERFKLRTSLPSPGPGSPMTSLARSPTRTSPCTRARSKIQSWYPIRHPRPGGTADPKKAICSFRSSRRYSGRGAWTVLSRVALALCAMPLSFVGRTPSSAADPVGSSNLLKNREAGRGRPVRVTGPAPLICSKLGKLSRTSFAETRSSDCCDLS